MIFHSFLYVYQAGYCLFNKKTSQTRSQPPVTDSDHPAAQVLRRNGRARGMHEVPERTVYAAGIRWVLVGWGISLG